LLTNSHGQEAHIVVLFLSFGPCIATCGDLSIDLSGVSVPPRGKVIARGDTRIPLQLRDFSALIRPTSPYFLFLTFKSFRIDQFHLAEFLALTVKRSLGDFVLAADRLNSLIAVGIGENTDDFFGAVRLLFHEYFLLGKGKKSFHYKRSKYTRSVHLYNRHFASKLSAAEFHDPPAPTSSPQPQRKNPLAKKSCFCYIRI